MLKLLNHLFQSLIVCHPVCFFFPQLLNLLSIFTSIRVKHNLILSKLGEILTRSLNSLRSLHNAYPFSPFCCIVCWVGFVLRKGWSGNLLPMTEIKVFFFTTPPRLYFLVCVCLFGFYCGIVYFIVMFSTFFLHNRIEIHTIWEKWKLFLATFRLLMIILFLLRFLPNSVELHKHPAANSWPCAS